MRMFTHINWYEKVLERPLAVQMKTVHMPSFGIKLLGIYPKEIIQKEERAISTSSLYIVYDI